MLRPAPRYESGAGLLFGAFVSRRIYVHLASLWVERLRPIKEGEVEYHAWEDGGRQ